MSNQDERYQAALRIARRKVGFIRHAVIYLIVIVGLAVINNATWGGYQWWLWTAFGWGIGVTAHFFSAFFFQSGALVDRIARHEMDRMHEEK
jgi:hypothetical protein